MTRFFSIQAAADFLQVDYKLVYRLVKERRIPSSRVGWQVRMTEEDLTAYLNAERVKQAAQAQALRPPPTAGSAAEKPGAEPLPDAPPPVTPVQTPTDAEEGLVSKLRARQMEINFINRFKEKLSAVETLRHPATQQMIRVGDWAQFLEESDEQERLMHALETAYLDRRVLATTPRNASARYTAPGEPPLVFLARGVAHIETFCRTGADHDPAALDDLMVEIDALEEAHRLTGAVAVAGLASPTGWDEATLAYIGGSAHGDTYRHPAVKLVLVDLSTRQLTFDRFDPVTAGFVGLFDQATDSETLAGLRSQLKEEVDNSLSRGVLLDDMARSMDVSLDLLLAAARQLAAADGYRIIEDSQHGYIVVQA